MDRKFVSQVNLWTAFLRAQRRSQDSLQYNFTDDSLNGKELLPFSQFLDLRSTRREKPMVVFDFFFSFFQYLCCSCTLVALMWDFIFFLWVFGAHRLECRDSEVRCCFLGGGFLFLFFFYPNGSLFGAMLLTLLLKHRNSKFRAKWEERQTHHVLCVFQSRLGFWCERVRNGKG